jgi:hypothetical protein
MIDMKIMTIEQFYEKWIYREPGECPTLEAFIEWLYRVCGE